MHSSILYEVYIIINNLQITNYCNIKTKDAIIVEKSKNFDKHDDCSQK